MSLLRFVQQVVSMICFGIVDQSFFYTKTIKGKKVSNGNYEKAEPC